MPAEHYKTLDLDQFRCLDYPPDHPLTLAMEFAGFERNPNVHGTYSEIVAGWVRDQRPSFAIKLILESERRNQVENLMAFGRAAATYITEPEVMLHALLPTLTRSSDSSSAFAGNDAGNTNHCNYCRAVCEGYAESGRMDRILPWLSSLVFKAYFKATVHRITVMLLERGQIDIVERWAESLPTGTATETLWTLVAQFRLQRGELDAVMNLVVEKLKGPEVVSLRLLASVVCMLRKGNRKLEVEKWVAIALNRIRWNLDGDEVRADVPFEIICACSWLGKKEAVEYLWPHYRSQTLDSAWMADGKGGDGAAGFVEAVREAHLARLDDLTDRVAGLYQEYLQGYNLPCKTLAAAREMLLNRKRAVNVLDARREKQDRETAAMDFVTTCNYIDGLPAAEREPALCNLVYKYTKKEDWSNAIAALTKVSNLPNPQNGDEYVRRWGQIICVKAGRAESLSKSNLADLRGILAKVCASSNALQ